MRRMPRIDSHIDDDKHVYLLRPMSVHADRSPAKSASGEVRKAAERNGSIDCRATTLILMITSMCTNWDSWASMLIGVSRKVPVVKCSKAAEQS